MIWASVAGVVLAAVAIFVLVSVGTSAYGAADAGERTWGPAGEFATPEVPTALTQGSIYEEPRLAIRGISAINSSSELLYGIDGIRRADIQLGLVNPGDTGDIIVPRDASSASIYGSRAANGVITITDPNGDNVSPFVGVQNRVPMREVAEAFFSDAWESFADSRCGKAICGLFEKYAPDMFERYRLYREGEPAICGDSTVALNSVVEWRWALPIATASVSPLKNSGISVTDDAYLHQVKGVYPGASVQYLVGNLLPRVTTAFGYGGLDHVIGEDICNRWYDLVRFASFAGSDGRTANFTVDGADFNNEYRLGTFYGYEVYGIYN